jgi:hypothetical protein
MILNDVKHRLWNGIEDSVRSLGFRFRKNAKEFVREIPGGTQVFYVRIIQRKFGEIVVEPWWCIRLNAIADIYNQVNTKDKEFHSSSCVFENTLGRLQYYIKPDLGLGVKNLLYYINNNEDLETLTKEIPIRFKQFVLPYFDQNSSIERADALLNDNPREMSPHNCTYPYKAMMGLIAAKLTKNPRFAELKNIYEEKLAPADPSLKGEFNKLKLLLENY